jgi:hypothetical protein
MPRTSIKGEGYPRARAFPRFVYLQARFHQRFAGANARSTHQHRGRSTGQNMAAGERQMITDSTHQSETINRF